jgi:hypothetical protein
MSNRANRFRGRHEIGPFAGTAQRPGNAMRTVARTGKLLASGIPAWSAGAGIEPISNE